jgi:hypothetical protein
VIRTLCLAMLWLAALGFQALADPPTDIDACI